MRGVDWGPSPEKTTREYKGVALKYLHTCKFCKQLTSSEEAYLHQGTWVCPDCWDERLRVTQ